MISGFGLVRSRGGAVDVLHFHAGKPCFALVFELAPRAVHAGLRVVAVVADDGVPKAGKAANDMLADETR